MNKQDSSGAFSADGKAYVIQTPNTPAAGANYLFNKNFFAYVTQTGQGESRALWPAKICLHQTAPVHQNLLRDKRECCKTQIWIAICVYLLVAITKKRLNIEQSLYTILQILSVSVFEKMPLLQAFQSTGYSNGGGDVRNRFSLWD